MSKDLSDIYDGWDFQPGPPLVRKIIGNDGKPKLQLRTDLGVFQMELHGRPDGKRPYGKESLLEHYESLLVNHRQRHGTESGFHLTMEDFAGLHQEAIQYYHRYVSLFQLEEYEGVKRDTERNLRLIEFMTKHAHPPEMAGSISQFRPYVLMMNVKARAHLALKNNDYQKAVDEIERGIETIRECYESASGSESSDISPELKVLEAWLIDLRSKRPLTARELLQKALEEAVAREDYERAALLRDQLKALDQPTT